MNNVYVFSQPNFNKECELMKLNDDNVNKEKDKAFISIIGTENSLKYYLKEEDTKHYFKKNHKNVLNLEFDDVDENTEYEGYILMAITKEQAEKAVNFIENNIGKDIYVHCRVGQSRSKAFYCFVADFYPNYYKLYRNANDTPNHGVYMRLARAYYKKHKIYEEE